MTTVVKITRTLLQVGAQFCLFEAEDDTLAKVQCTCELACLSVRPSASETSVCVCVARFDSTGKATLAVIVALVPN